jgi:hypothetical protein
MAPTGNVGHEDEAALPGRVLEVSGACCAFRRRRSSLICCKVVGLAVVAQRLGPRGALETLTRAIIKCLLQYDRKLFQSAQFSNSGLLILQPNVP